MWFNDFTKHSLAVEKEPAQNGSNVITEPFNPKSKDKRHAWKLAPCSKPKEDPKKAAPAKK